MLQSLEIYFGNNNECLVGILIKSELGELSLEYNQGWKKIGFPLSPSLPFNEVCKHVAINSFLLNLLPEGVGFDELLEHTKISRSDVLALLSVIGNEVTGGFSFRIPKETTKGTDIRYINDEELCEKLRFFKKGLENLTIWDNQPILSVSGVQAKLNLFDTKLQLAIRDTSSNSNCILKFETGRFPFIVVNEYFTMLLAKNSGLMTPSVALFDFDGIKALGVERFDREVSKNGKLIKKHIIDACQVYGVSPLYKYERQFGDGDDVCCCRDGVSFLNLFSINVKNKVRYHDQLIQWMVFNLLVKNYDAHGKNISFYSDQQGLRLAPYYDIVNIEALMQSNEGNGFATTALHDDRSSRCFAMSVGGWGQGVSGNFTGNIKAYDLADFADELGISLKRMQKIVCSTITKTVNSLDMTSNQLPKILLSELELQHIELCKKIINETASSLMCEAKKITSMSDLF